MWTLKSFLLHKPRGWFGISAISNPEKKLAFLHEPVTRKHLIVSLDHSKLEEDTLHRIAWDVGLISPSGYRSDSMNQELAYSLYTDDLAEYYSGNKQRLATDIWSRLQYNHSVVFTK